MRRERKLLRLKDYDYSASGAYFITTCVYGRKNEFGFVENGIMILNEYGKIVEQQWQWLFRQYNYLKMGSYCVMPNHFHGILWICPERNDHPVGNGRDHPVRKKIKPIPELIGAFKTTSSKLIHLAGNPHFKWQKSFYDVIIRNDESYYKISEYIINNPKNWKNDVYHER